MIRSWLLQVLEHGTVPAIVLALAIAPINSSSWQRHDLTKPTKLRKGVLFSASTTGAMTIRPRDHEPAIASTKARSLTAVLTAPTTGCTAERGQTNCFSVKRGLLPWCAFGFQ